jgi:protein-disulfide isomerase
MRLRVKKALSGAAILSMSLIFLQARAGAQTQGATNAATPATATAAPGQLQKNIETFLRHLYAFGPDVTVKIGIPRETGVESLLEADVLVKIGDGEQTGKVYISKDGRYLFRGELSDLSKDPLAETRAQLQINNAPSLGDPKASVTLVEFSDFECPVCRSLHDTLRGLLPHYPQVRVVFKDFPIEQLHPWARTAAIAGRCAYQQDPKAFWKLYDLIYDNQDLISPENAWTKMLDYGAQAGANADAFKACMSGPEASAAVDASRSNGLKLEVTSTPTVFVNGRRMVGADPATLEQYIRYELDQQKTQKVTQKN